MKAVALRDAVKAVALQGGAKAVVILIPCTGTCEGLQSERAWLVEPDHIIPATVAGLAPTATLGEAVFAIQCLPCHRLNGGGASEIGPDLGQPMAATDYTTEPVLRALVRDPKSVRTGRNSKCQGFPQPYCRTPISMPSSLT